MEEKPRTSPRGETTRDVLLDAATLIFARAGYQAANIREIAEAAEVNPALIGYHFHGKEGLYLAVFERMIAQLRLVMDAHMAQVELALREPEADLAPEVRRERYLPPLLGLLEGLLVHMVHEHPAWGELIVREQFAPTAAFDLLYQGIFSRGHGALSAMVHRLRPDQDTEWVRLLAASLVAQVLIIRNSRALLKRLLAWNAIGDRELETLKALLRRNVTLLVLGD